MSNHAHVLLRSRPRGREEKAEQVRITKEPISLHACQRIQNNVRSSDGEDGSDGGCGTPHAQIATFPSALMRRARSNVAIAR